jgi:structural maintenance of chromosome 4
LNGKQKEYGAVRDLLLSHGIDLDNNRFLILQGEVEQIAMMKPKGDAFLKASYSASYDNV